MKIQYASDLHLEFGANTTYLKQNPLEVTGDILVLAGDIGYLGDDNYQKHPFWNWASDNYQRVLVIPGNHELYKFFDINKLYNGWEFQIRKNVSCHYNSVIELDKDISLIVSTLWSYIPDSESYITEHGVSDFYRILNGDNTLDFKRFNQEHALCFDFIKHAVQQCNTKHIIVATHHVPSFQLMSSEFEGSKINGAFIVELQDFIQNSPIEYWIYGHSHRNIDKIIGNTKCLSNQLGYVSSNEHLTFDHGKHIIIERD